MSSVHCSCGESDLTLLRFRLFRNQVSQTTFRKMTDAPVHAAPGTCPDLHGRAILRAIPMSSCDGSIGGPAQRM